MVYSEHRSEIILPHSYYTGLRGVGIEAGHRRMCAVARQREAGSRRRAGA